MPTKTRTRSGRRPKVTAEQSAAFAEQRATAREEVRAIADEFTARLSDPAVWLSLLDAAAVHQGRGAINTMIIAATAPEATDLRGYQVWRSAGRQVRKGEHGRVRLFLPVTHTKGESGAAADGLTAYDPADAPDTTQERGDGRVRGWNTGVVFDVSQTDPIAPDAEPYTAPSLPQRPAGALLTALTAHLADAGVTVVTSDEPDMPVVFRRAGTQYEARVNAALTPAAKVRALLPAWVATARRGEDPHAPGWAEEIESTAHLTARMVGIEPGPAPVPPLAGWISADPTEDPMRDAAKRVIKIGRALAVQLSYSDAEQD